MSIYRFVRGKVLKMSYEFISRLPNLPMKLKYAPDVQDARKG